MGKEKNLESWDRFLKWAKGHCSPATFGNWLAPIEVAEADGESITLIIPNIFVKEYLLAHYRDELKIFFPVDKAGEPQLHFTVKEREKSPSEGIETKKREKTYHPSNRFASQLNPNYQFDTFIEGPSNQFIKSAAIGVAARPGLSYSPLFIHGEVGLGKTHLLHSIGHAIQRNQRNLCVHCITSEAFINDIVECLRSKSIEKMKRYYRSEVDVLLVDDIQFLQNRLNFEEEFCNTFETLINQNKQLVITSDKPPAELKLSGRLIGRMEWGLVTHVAIPDLETRVAILQSKAEQRGVALPTEVAFLLAEALCRNVRQLEGAINRLAAHSKLLDLPISVELVQAVLSEMVQGVSSWQPISIDQILQSVAAIFEVRVKDLKGAVRKREYTVPRQVAMYLSCKLFNGTLQVISDAFGKTHSTILYAYKSVEKRMRSDRSLSRMISMVERHIER